MTMKAVLVEKPGGIEQLDLRDVPVPEPAEAEVLLAIKATALNRADILQRRGLYPPPKGVTDILGLECSGLVSQLGPGCSEAKVGDRVMALLPGGGYAEYVSVPESMLMTIPECLSFDEATAIPEAFLTASEALFHLGSVAKGSTVLIHAAAGGVGSAAVQLAAHCGAVVIATAGSDEKTALASQLGAQHSLNYRETEVAKCVREITNGRGVDCIVDFLGGGAWASNSRCLSIGGRCVVVGVLAGPTATVNFGALLQKQQQILGLVMRSRSLEEKTAITETFIERSLPLFADGSLRPVLDQTFALADVPEAHTRMDANANLGKIILTVD